MAVDIVDNSSLLASQIRELALRLVHKAKASHIASALSIADLLSVMFADSQIYSLNRPRDPNRDRLILSKGHACVSLYSALHLKGFFSREDLFTYGDDFSAFMNHASHKVPGVEFSTGALGHGLPIACGKALAARLCNNTFHNFVIMSDGELQEGSNWEAFMYASHHNLANITVCIDYNNLQSLTTVDQTISLQPLSKKLSAFGWKVLEVDGHNHSGLSSALKAAKGSPRPTALILKTIKGKGVSFMENSVEWHYKCPNDQQLADAIKQVNIK